MEALTVERWGWCPEAESGLSDTFGDEKELIATLVQRGIATIWRINGGESWLITRPEDKELVIMCLQGRNAPAIIDHIKRTAKAAGFTSLRAHTQRRGLLRMFKKYGAVQREIVIGMGL